RLEFDAQPPRQRGVLAPGGVRGAVVGSCGGVVLDEGQRGVPVSHVPVVHRRDDGAAVGRRPGGQEPDGPAGGGEGGGAGEREAGMPSISPNCSGGAAPPPLGAVRRRSASTRASSSSTPNGLVT